MVGSMKKMRLGILDKLSDKLAHRNSDQTEQKMSENDLNWSFIKDIDTFIYLQMAQKWKKKYSGTEWQTDRQNVL